MAAILVIDDNSQMRRMVAQVLNQLGHVVHEARGGAEGLALFRQIKPALVISDIVMPDVDGIETIREIRREAPSMPILAISGGTANELYLRSAKVLGASASLEKPFHADQLRAVIGKLLADSAP